MSHINNLVRAWNCLIKGGYLKTAKNSYIKSGMAGMSIFSFLSGTHDTKQYNCEYSYAEKDEVIWKMIMGETPNRKELLNIYNSKKNLMVCVQIPISHTGYEYINNIRIFDIDNLKEIIFEKNKIDKTNNKNNTLRKRNVV